MSLGVGQELVWFSRYNIFILMTNMGQVPGEMHFGLDSPRYAILCILVSAYTICVVTDKVDGPIIYHHM